MTDNDDLLYSRSLAPLEADAQPAPASPTLDWQPIRVPPHRPFVAGVYPLLEDETCFFLAADFDKAGWQDDAAAFVRACRRLHLPVALERSRSGQGGHVWLFFEEALPAAMARRLGSHLLTEAMEARPDIGLDSYDRLFPSQDTMPRGGFGRACACPCRKRGKTSRGPCPPRAGARSHRSQASCPRRWSWFSPTRSRSPGKDCPPAC